VRAGEQIEGTKRETIADGQEKIRAAAIRIPQGVFEGANHAEIIDRLAREYGEKSTKYRRWLRHFHGLDLSIAPRQIELR